MTKIKINKRNLERARLLAELCEENEKKMVEQAAYVISCQRLNIDPEEGYELLALLAEEE